VLVALLISLFQSFNANPPILRGNLTHVPGHGVSVNVVRRALYSPTSVLIFFFSDVLRRLLFFVFLSFLKFPTDASARLRRGINWRTLPFGLGFDEFGLGASPDVIFGPIFPATPVSASSVRWLFAQMNGRTVRPFLHEFAYYFSLPSPRTRSCTSIPPPYSSYHCPYCRFLTVSC